MGSPNISDYLFLNVIGVGSNSTVFKAIRKDNPEELVAIKCFNFSRISKQTVNKIIESADFLKSLKHENIVQLKEFFISRSRMYFVLEYCDGGTFSNIISNILEINEVLCRTYMQQLGSALKYLHSNNIFHLNLKPENLLVVTKPYITLKVGDYGFAQHLTRKEYKSNIHGSPIYKSPEILLDEYFDNRADLWSIGVIIYECLFKKLPYYGLINEMTDKIKQRHQIEIPQIPRISNECKNLLTSLLQPVLNYRLTFEEFFSDKFVDLEHIPCEENFIKAKNIVMAGRDFEFENKLKEANDMYSEALKYFVPMLSSELFEDRKNFIKLNIHDLIYRTEEIELQLRYDNIENMIKSPRELTEPPIYYSIISKKISAVLTGTLGDLYEKLVTLSLSSPELYGGLEMGEAGVLYLSEGQYARAAELFQKALDELIPVLKNEPPSIRRNLLQEQVDLWDKLHMAAVSHFTKKGVYTKLAMKSREFCVLQ